VLTCCRLSESKVVHRSLGYSTLLPAPLIPRPYCCEWGYPGLLAHYVQLASESSLHWSYLGQVERGQRNVTLHNILKLAEVLRVDPGDLVRGLRAPDGAAR